MINEGGPVSSAAAVTPRTTRNPEAREARPSWMGARIDDVARGLGQRYLERLTAKRRKLSETMASVPTRMHRVGNQTRLMLEAIDDFKCGEYRELPWRSVAVMAAAALYAANPADVVPDTIPFLGQLDDVALVALAVRIVQRDLRAYCRYKGYPEDEYF